MTFKSSDKTGEKKNREKDEDSIELDNS